MPTQHALVTGGSRGIGRAAALALAAAGAHVLVHYGTSADDARSVVEQIRAKGGKAPGREGLFDLIRTTPDTLRYEHGLILAEGDHVMVHGRFSGTGRPSPWIAVDILRIENGQLAEHWDVLQDEATGATSVSGLPMFGAAFPA